MKLVVNTHSSPQTLTRQKPLWTLVHTSLMLLSVGLSLVVYLGIKLLRLLVKALLEKLSSVFAVVKNFLDTNPDAYCLYF